MTDPCALVVDVQILMIASGKSDPPDDGSGVGLLTAIKECAMGSLVWDSEGRIRAQYEQKLTETTFAREWLSELLLQGKVIEVDRVKFSRGDSVAIRETGLVGEDLNIYVRTAAGGSEKRLVSQDSDYDQATCKVLRKRLGVQVHSASGGAALVRSRQDEHFRSEGVDQEVE